MSTVTYRANCHCKAYILETRVPKIESVVGCNCSSCKRRGALWSLTSDYNFVQGDESTLSDYPFGDFHYKFCTTCGTNLLVIGHDTDKGNRVGVNVRAIQNLDVWSLKIDEYKPDNVPAWSAPAFKGQEPQAELEGSRMYTGSCHCGAVTMAVKSKPLDENSGVPAFECNCSICGRNAWVGLWFKNEYCSLEGLDNTTQYSMGSGTFARSHCKTCGVVISNKSVPVSEEARAAMPDMAKQWYERGLDNWSLSARVLNDVSIEEVKPQRVDGWNFIQPMYVNP
ncbi:glutathione-dependent formaldehyde-activating enzyme [Xylariaceae sp. FL1272]|nr:glutathione-dependent formaldehyde-activating enzyme [Xylariaceae sp. FL1272]